MNWTKIHHELRIALNISPFHYFVLDIVYNCTLEYGHCNLTREELSKKIGAGVRTVKQYCKDLEKMELIHINGNRNIKISEVFIELITLMESDKVQYMHQKVRSLHLNKSAKSAPVKCEVSTLESAKSALTPIYSKNNNKSIEIKEIKKLSKEEKIEAVKEEAPLVLLHLEAAKQMNLFFKDNSGALKALKNAAYYSGSEEETEKELNKFFAHFSDNSYFIKEAIKNPAKYTGKFQKWLSNSKDFKPKNKTNEQKKGISDNFRNKINEAIDNW